MDKLQLYFDFFEKYKFEEHRNWYENLKKYIDIVQTIKSKLNGKDSTSWDETKKDKVEKILSDSSEDKFKSVESFFQKYLFDKDNNLGGVAQGAIWDTEKNPHKSLIKEKLDTDLLINLLTPDIRKSIEIINKLLGGEGISRNYNVVKFRLLRAIFPAEITSLDSEYKLNELIEKIQEKLDIPIQGIVIEKHLKLMNSIKSDDYCKKQIFFWELRQMLENELNIKKAIVYYGAPGTGKTYKARNVATEFIDQHRIKIGKDNKKDISKYQIKTVQFHPSYSYEDFMEGIRPSSDGKLILFNGTFKEFCKRTAQKEIDLYKNIDFLKNENFKANGYDFSTIKISELNEEQKNILDVNSDLPAGITIDEVIEPAFFIIDEINRAELSRVFGELMYSLEYRGYNGKINTQYSYLNKEEHANSVYFWENGEDWFFIPQNVYIIGTMNNIDRSVDSFDFALRRRFMWEEIQPNFDIVENILEATWKKDLAQSFKNLNSSIEKEEVLGKDYRIGHSYALVLKPIQNRFEDVNEAKNFLWKDFISPLLEEYLRGLGDEKKSVEKLASFKKAFGLE